MEQQEWNKSLAENSLKQCPTLGNEIFRLLRHRILSGYYKREERLSEAKLAAEFKTSRSPIREAFIQLENTGLIKTMPRKGVYVYNFTASDVREIAELRSLLEQFIVRVLIEEKRITKDAIQKLQTIIEEMEQLCAKEGMSDEELTYQGSRLDFRFHMTLAELAGRPSFYELIRTTMTRSRAIIGLMHVHPGTRQVIEDHLRFVEALKQGDVLKAQQIVSEHLRWMLADDAL